MNRPILLCVDDEVIILESLQDQLKRYFGKRLSGRGGPQRTGSAGGDGSPY